MSAVFSLDQVLACTESATSEYLTTSQCLSALLGWSDYWPYFYFYETQYLHFTTRVFGHSAITAFLGGLHSACGNGKSTKPGMSNRRLTGPKLPS